MLAETFVDLLRNIHPPLIGHEESLQDRQSSKYVRRQID